MNTVIVAVASAGNAPACIRSAQGDSGRPGFVYTAYIFTFGTVVRGASRDFLLTALIVRTALGFLWVPIAGHLSDRIGRRRMYMVGACFSGLYGFVYFALLETRSPVLIFLAIALSLIPIMTLYGP